MAAAISRELNLQLRASDDDLTPGTGNWLSSRADPIEVTVNKEA